MVTSLKIGVLTRNEESWCSAQLKNSLAGHDVTPFCFDFRSLVARVELKPEVSADGADLLRNLRAIIVRPIGRGSLEEIVFRRERLA